LSVRQPQVLSNFLWKYESRMTLTDERYTTLTRNALRDITRGQIKDPSVDEFDVVNIGGVVNGWVKKNYEEVFGSYDSEEIVKFATVNDDQYLYYVRQRDGLNAENLIQLIARETVAQELYESIRGLEEEMQMAITIHDTIDSLVDPTGKVNPYPSEFVNYVYDYADGHTVDAKNGSLPPYEVDSTDGYVVDDAFKQRFNETHARRLSAIDVIDTDPDRQENPVISIVGAYLFEEWSDQVRECDIRFE